MDISGFGIVERAEIFMRDILLGLTGLYFFCSTTDLLNEDLSICAKFIGVGSDICWEGLVFLVETTILLSALFCGEYGLIIIFWQTNDTAMATNTGNFKNGYLTAISTSKTIVVLKAGFFLSHFFIFYVIISYLQLA